MIPTDKPEIVDLIKVIEDYKLLGLAWNFDECPLMEVKNLDTEYALEKDGEILSGLRTVVVLHHKENPSLVPVHMIDRYEIISISDKFQITISIMQIPMAFE